MYNNDFKLCILKLYPQYASQLSNNASQIMKKIKQLLINP
jgi:hypothetical protein